MKRANHIPAVFMSGFALINMLLLMTVTVHGQGLVNRALTPTPDRQQQTYLNTVTDNPINGEPTFVAIDLNVLKGERFTLDLGTGETYLVSKVDRGSNYGAMTSWCGTIELPDHEDGQVNMVINGDELVAHFAVADRIFRITPLGDGLHVLYEVFTDKLDEEECFEGGDLDYDYDPGPNMGPDEQDIPDLRNNRAQSGAKSTGECKIRVLIGYTYSAEQQFTSILAELNNLINIANTSYNEAAVGFNIEMAAAIQYAYTETGNLNTDLSRWRATSDGYMDDVHGDRSLYDADMCALIVNDGGGIAYLSLSYGDQFSVTGTGNFGVYTFHHELGHNMLCTHDLVNTSQPGTAPYAGYGHSSGCFRTIMAYSEACGASPCTRVNIWSRSVDTYYCGGNFYPRGGTNNRNRDRLVLSKSTVNNHQTVLNDSWFAGDYNWYDEEAIHMAANNSWRYESSTNNWDMFSGSEGSFRASSYVTLGEGFHARAGATFTAYIESCTPLPDESAIADNAGGESESAPTTLGEELNATESASSEFVEDFTVYPNPFEDFTTVEFEIREDRHLLITVRDLMGREVLTMENGALFPQGHHQIDIPTGDWASGIYLLSVQSGDRMITRRIVKSK